MATDSMRRRRVVLVTGTPRSGTTAVGDVLSYGRGTRYLYEPFNYHVGMRGIDRYFEVPGAASFPVARLDDHVDAIERLRLDLKPGVFPHDTGWKRAVKRVVGSRTRVSYLACRLDPTLRTVVWKDPMAAFAADHVARHRGIPVAVTVRNPWAVAASFKRMGWGFDVVAIVERLREAGGEDHRGLVEEVGAEVGDPVANAAVLWHLVNAAVLASARSGAPVHLVDVDSLVDDPVPVYERLYRLLDLPWSGRVERRIRRRYTGDGRGAEPTPGKAHDRNRDVRAMATYWEKVLDPAEADLVERIDAGLWSEVQAAVVV